MQISKPTLNRFRLIVLGFVGLIMVLVVIVWSVASKVPGSPIVFGHLAVPTSTNASFVCVAFTNQSDFVVLYVTEPLEVSSNGIWSGPPVPARQRLTKLLARQSGVVVVDAASTNQNARVPVLWGYDYTPRATKWQQLCEDFMGRISGRGGSGFLYTNYLTAVKL